MIASILLLLSIAAFAQFTIYYWRATIATTSRTPVSDRVRMVAGIPGRTLSSHDFRVILNLHNLTPGLGGSSRTFRAIRAYFFIVEKLGQLIPNVTEWAETEMTMCSNYMAVLLEQHLEHNTEYAARLRAM